MTKHRMTKRSPKSPMTRRFPCSLEIRSLVILVIQFVTIYFIQLLIYMTRLRLMSPTSTAHDTRASRSFALPCRR